MHTQTFWHTGPKYFGPNLRRHIASQTQRTQITANSSTRTNLPPQIDDESNRASTQTFKLVRFLFLFFSGPIDKGFSSERYHSRECHTRDVASTNHVIRCSQHNRSSIPI